MFLDVVEHFIVGLSATLEIRALNPITKHVNNNDTKTESEGVEEKEQEKKGEKEKEKEKKGRKEKEKGKRGKEKRKRIRKEKKRKTHTSRMLSWT